MADHITACRKCGSTSFVVRESYTWFARLYDGAFDCSSPHTQIDEINCEGCGEGYATADFAGIDFN